MVNSVNWRKLSQLLKYVPFVSLGLKTKGFVSSHGIMSLSNSEDDLVSYGTPVELLEEDEIPNKKPRLVEDQMVKDKQGRRRFHGAFTGGFSAGFFNTVGSLEGWAPSSFKSSKFKKQEIFQQKPEDFMDEEDVSEFGIAPVVLKARDDYTIERKIEGPAFSEFLTLGTYVLQDVLKHVRETIGIKLLKKMGWKPGQGVGPRLNKNDKKNSLKMRQKTYGCQLPPGSLEEKETDSDSDSEWNDIQFAPSDYEPFLYMGRNNFCGLGYEGLDKRPVLSENSSMKGGDNKKRNINKKFGSQAFGVGAFEEEDEDIYAKDDMSRYNFFLGKDESTDGNKSADKKSFTLNGALDGFALETKTFTRKNYPLPTIPKDHKPHHKVRHSRFNQPSSNSNEAMVKGLRDSYENRRKLLEEASEETMETKKWEELSARKLILNVEIFGSKFKPFLSDPDKQERYENYLKLIKIGRKELLGDLQPFSMTNWDKEREKVEFEKAALLFRPLSGGMEDRFATASQPDDLSDPLAVVQKFSDENDERRKAAKMKMFGPVTRRKEYWIPDPLLCKRFNIPDPEKSHVQSSERQKVKPFFDLFDSAQNFQGNMEKIEIVDVSSREKPNQEESQILEAKDENLSDLYKAIFLVSDDEEGTEIKNSDEERNSNISSEKKENSEGDILFEEKFINCKRNLSPPKGIFKNIDLELLSGSKKKETSVPEVSIKNDTSESKESGEMNTTTLNLVYGPQIPEKVSVKTFSFTGEPFEDGGVWVEKKNRCGKKHKKKDKKSKKASRKSKHKHKRKR